MYRWARALRVGFTDHVRHGTIVGWLEDGEHPRTYHYRNSFRRHQTQRKQRFVAAVYRKRGKHGDGDSRNGNCERDKTGRCCESSDEAAPVIPVVNMLGATGQPVCLLRVLLSQMVEIADDAWRAWSGLLVLAASYTCGLSSRQWLQRV